MQEVQSSIPVSGEDFMGFFVIAIVGFYYSAAKNVINYCHSFCNAISFNIRNMLYSL